MPIHEKVFATMGNVDHHRKERVPDFEDVDFFAPYTSLDERYTTVDADGLEALVAERDELREVNEGLRLQIEYLNAELANALNVPPAITGNHYWTHHGHPCCEGSEPIGERPALVARCGGPGLCQKCSNEAVVLHAR